MNVGRHRLLDARAQWFGKTHDALHRVQPLSDRATEGAISRLPMIGIQKQERPSLMGHVLKREAAGHSIRFGRRLIEQVSLHWGLVFEVGARDLINQLASREIDVDFSALPESFRIR